MRKISFSILWLGILLVLISPIFLFHIDSTNDVYILEFSSPIPSGVSNGHTIINMTYTQLGEQAAVAVLQKTDGSFVLGGYQGNSLGAGLMLLGADAEGNYEWNMTCCPGASLRRMIPLSDGGFALFGSILPEGGEYYDWLLARVNSTNSYQWNQTYGNTGFDYPAGIAELNDGFMLSGTWTNTTTSNLDYMIIRTDVNGTQLWNATFGDSQDQWCTQMIRSSDGAFILCGYTSNPITQTDIWLLKVDSSGHQLWNRTFGTNLNDYARDIVELSNGGFAIAGGISSDHEGDLLLLRLDSDGNQLWNNTFSGGTNRTFEAFSIVETSDHGFCLRGRNTDLEFVDVYWLLRTDSNGNSLWEYPLGSKSVRVYAIINARGGGFITAGATGEYGTEEWDFHLMLFPELSWLVEPANQFWFTNVIPIPSYQLNATSAAPIQSWQVNNTHFSIDSQGILTNATSLNGTYYLHITVSDAIDNILSTDIVVHAIEKTLITTVTGTTSPGSLPPPNPVVLILTLGAIAASIIIGLVVWKRFLR